MRSTTILIIAGLALGCGSDSGSIWSASTVRDNQPSGLSSAAQLAVDPLSLGFGPVSLGEQAEATLTLSNIGGQSLVIDDISVADPDLGFGVGQITDTILAQDQSTVVTVWFEPDTRDDRVSSLLITTSDVERPVYSVPVSGVGEAPLMQVDPADGDFGSVFVGCEDQLPVVVSNLGNADLTIASIDVQTDSDAMVVDLDEAVHGPLPWTVAAGDSIEIQVDYIPLEEREDDVLITVSSDDPTASQAQVQIWGEGVIAGVAAESFTVEQATRADVLFAIDRSTSMHDDISTFITDFHRFTDALVAAGLDPHVAAVVEDDGCVVGSTLFIDDSFASADVGSTVEQMINLGATYGSNTEKAFSLWDAALSQTGADGCNAGLVRPGAALHLIGVSDEAEQSGGSASAWVTTLQGYVDDPETLVVDGIGGDYPDGCGTADAYTGVYQASLATGGTLLSICDTMSSNLAQLASVVIATTDHGAGTGAFGLVGTPVPETIQVTVAGDPVYSGWAYVDKMNAVIFDVDNIPAEGSDVRVDYVIATECDTDD